MTVVRDDEEGVALRFPKGTRWKAPITPSTREREPTRGERLATAAALGAWTFADAEWDVSTLCLMRPHAWHAIWISWLDDGRHWGRYVNLQRPYRRTSCSFEAMDLMLDVVIELDGSWRWKDEDELETFVERGVFDRVLVARIHAEPLEVIRSAERGEPPFDGTSSRRRRDVAWPRPELPQLWEERCR